MNDTIFVSIASYRDKSCNETIKNLLKMSKYPNNIYIGICEQNKQGDLDVLYDIDNKNINIIRISYKDAKGPVYARYLCSQLYNNEKYFMQIDSHSKFIKHWDIKCIYAIKNIKKFNLSQKPVLSHYPRSMKDYDDFSDSKKNKITYVKDYSINSYDVIKFNGAKFIETNNSFIKTPYVTGGFIFTEGSFLKEIPYDDKLEYLFTGEEILNSIRFYTYGYDIFIPNENIIFHNYIRNDEPKLWDDIDYIDKKKIINKKIADVLKCKTNADINKIINKGVGFNRDIKDYYKLINYIN
jgi:hypothetical protein